MSMLLRIDATFSRVCLSITFWMPFLRAQVQTACLSCPCSPLKPSSGLILAQAIFLLSKDIECDALPSTAKALWITNFIWSTSSCYFQNLLTWSCDCRPNVHSPSSRAHVQVDGPATSRICSCRSNIVCFAFALSFQLLFDLFIKPCKAEHGIVLGDCLTLLYIQTAVEIFL